MELFSEGVFRSAPQSWVNSTVLGEGFSPCYEGFLHQLEGFCSRPFFHGSTTGLVPLPRASLVVPNSGFSEHQCCSGTEHH